MADRRVRISVDDKILVVSCVGQPQMMSGQFRVLMANVLGFDANDDELRYFRRTSVETPRELKGVLEFLQENQISVQLEDNVARILESHASAGAELQKARVIGESLKKKPARKLVAFPFQRELKPYQVPAVAHMTGVGNAANFSVPGSGKTTIVLAAFSILRARQDVESAVVVCPRSAFATWEEESRECLGISRKFIRIAGTKIERAKLYAGDARSADIAVLTYQTLTNDADELAAFMRQRATMLVLDESHYIKRIEGGRWANAVIDLAPLAKRRVVLSGTPVPNGLEDLWSQMAFLWPNPTPLGDRDEYRELLTHDTPEAVQEVQDVLHPLYWRIKKSDLHLPKPVFHRIAVSLEKYQQGIYNALATKVLADVVSNPAERTRFREWRRARMIRLLQAATNPSLLTEHSKEFRIPPLDASGLSIEQIVFRYSEFERPAKLDYAVSLAKELVGRGLKALIWTSFIHNIQTLEVMLREFQPRTIYGDIPKDAADDADFNRERMIDEFKNSNRYPILIGNPSACAESISLHKVCKHAIYVDRTFNGAHFLQSLDRIHRIGLGKNDRVHYHLLIARDTIDEVIDQRLEDKKRRMLQILDDDFGELDLESPQEAFSELSEEDQDFEALITFLQSKRERSLNA